MSNDYLWDRSGEGDDFVRALERRLAPLDEAEQIVASLELLDDQAEAEHAGRARGEERDELVLLHPLPPEAISPAGAERAAATRPSPGRGWPWLAAAVAVLAVSLGPLLGSSRLAAPSTVLRVGGVGEARVRVTIAADSHAILATLRPAHHDLARCVAEFEPAEPLELELEAEGRPRITASNGVQDPRSEAFLACVGEAVEELEVPGLARVSIEPR